MACDFNYIAGDQCLYNIGDQDYLKELELDHLEKRFEDISKGLQVLINEFKPKEEIL